MHPATGRRFQLNVLTLDEAWLGDSYQIGQVRERGSDRITPRLSTFANWRGSVSSRLFPISHTVRYTPPFAIVLGLLVTTGRARAQSPTGERYYITFFGTQAVPLRARYTHMGNLLQDRGKPRWRTIGAKQYPTTHRQPGERVPYFRR
jgi:hypothetical protein